MDPLMIKLSPPSIDNTSIIPRPRLINLLTTNVKWKVATIIAPAGYGKTTLLHQTVETLGRPFVWYQLDAYDNDLAIIVKYLLTGFGRIIPGFGRKTTQLLAQSGPLQNPHLTVSAMVNDLTQQTNQSILLILDDFHFITESAVRLFFQELLQYLPSNVRLIISSRNSIPLSISRLHAAGVLIPIALEDLRFTKKELVAYFKRRQAQFTEETIETIIQKSGGWPVVLRFFLESDAQPLTAEGKALSIYLADEVLRKQPQQICEFLLATSVLDYITPEIADSLLNRNDSAEILTYLTNEQLFISMFQGENQTFRYQPLFRDFLLDCLGREQKIVFFTKAAELALKRGEIGSTIEYYQRAGCIAEQIKLIEEAGLCELRNGHWQTVQR